MSLIVILLGLHVGEIKVIFTLPPRLGNFPHPLLYIHWFRPLQTLDVVLQAFRIAKSSRQHGPNAVVLPANLLLRPCHLIPCFSRQRVRDDVDEFYLNRYIDLDLFERLSY